MLSTLVYTRKGSGEPLVLFHGIGHRRQAWDPVLDLLAESYDVIAVDLAGFGESPAYPDGTPYTMDNAAADLTANFKAWGIEKPHVVGNSLGGAIALELGARGLVRSVTALSPAGFFRGADRIAALLLLLSLRLSAQLTPAPVLRAISRSSLGRRLIGYVLFNHPERFTADEVYGDSLALKRASAFAGTLKAGTTYKFTDRVPVPTTVAWGTRDRILFYAQSALAQERLPEAHHVALPHCGHVPMVDDPELIVRVIQQTTAKTAKAAAA